MAIHYQPTGLEALPVGHSGRYVSSWGMGSRILLIDDNPAVTDIVGRYLQHEGHMVLTAVNAVKGLRLAYGERPDLVVLDLMLLGKDGWKLFARLRELADFPIILLSSKASEADMLRSLRLGADDYVTKPFSLAELGARIKVVLALNQANPNPFGALYANGDLTVDMDKRLVRRGQEVILLTRAEFRLLGVLFQKSGQPVSEEKLAREVWGIYWRRNMDVVQRYIWRLRQKLEDDPAHPTRILTVHGFGYCLGTAPLTPPAGK